MLARPSGDEATDATVQELVADLVRPAHGSDRGEPMYAAHAPATMAVAVLASLTRLAATNTRLRTLVADALSPHWMAFAACLYDATTSLHALVCLASCIDNSRRHQRQMTRAIPGVVFQDASVMLYAVCVPERVNAAYKQWRRRQKALRGHRAPHGVPPDASGAPAPCYCNACLGVLQLFPTWRAHFYDLDLWRIDDDNDVRMTQLQKPPSLREYLEVVMAFHGRRFERHLLPRDPENPSAGGSATLYALRLPLNQEADIEEEEEEEEEICDLDARDEDGSLDPRRDIVALVVHEEVALELLQLQHDSAEETPDEVVQSPMTTSDSPAIAAAPAPVVVVLHEAMQRVSMCRYDARPSVVEPVSSLVEYLRSLHALFKRLDPNGDGSITKHEFMDALTDHATLRAQLEASFGDPLDGSALDDDRLEMVFTLIGAGRDTLEWDDFVAYFGDPIRMERVQQRALSAEVEATMAFLLRCLADDETSDDIVDCHMCSITVSANVDAQELRLEASRHDDAGEQRRFSASVPQASLCVLGKSPFALLQLTPESLEELVARVVLCYHPPHACMAAHGARLALREVPHTEAAAPSLVRAMATKASPTPIPGLSASMVAAIDRCKSALETQLQTMAFLQRENAAEFAVATTTQLRQWIDQCNARMTSLAQPSAFPKSTHALRAAARDRCQQIRRDLIDCARRIAMVDAQLWSAEATIDLVHVVVRTLHDVLRCSAEVHYWERRDERIPSLGLSNTVWANGYPDALYPKATEAARAGQKKRSNKLRRAVQAARRVHHQVVSK
ncbi:hypothetical protein SPRG_10487 [Saprolegnia parasitica CBS 223.65]|uniref:EF-hand domain-containing protein n=1 Tax=Saprolegnia parasitica (strain CBS 223.65) TaxID=695850 RepID=A0A067BYZ1_SAPPC|nr:hypothetical protein SPRG_10487 [Saprolegnia parasitica CBS 223.65]KDO23709.1 hypothetical protein SPRG_10487 [Saprolegnia parasitica CBS 223.65]|eukprot:XP_012205527.1 hypothetical protein SPRG_10487 [Saprolegnia parasitica CBS 223.65]